MRSVWRKIEFFTDFGIRFACIGCCKGSDFHFMTKDIIQKHRNEAIGYIASSRLRDAFRILRIMTPAQAWRIISEIDRAEEAYALMLRYTADGAADPQRNEVYAGIVSSMYSLLDRIVREATEADSPLLYFNIVRYERMQMETLSQLLSAYRKQTDNTSLFNMAMSGGSARKEKDQAEKEIAERRIFNKVWTEYPLDTDSVDALNSVFADDSLPSYFKEFLVSALLLGGLEYYEETRLMILLEIYSSARSVLALKALCAAVLIMYRYRMRPVSARLSSRIATLRDTCHWERDLKAVFLQLIRTRDTEKINRKVRDELMPQMLKLRPDLYRKINDTTAVIDLSEMEENPEWQELLENSGLADKMKELSQIQEDGGDVLMSTFSHLKTFPFFNELSNWFMPFHIDHSAVSESLGGGDTIGELIASTPFLCNSDKYSFILSLHQIPEVQQTMMISQFDEQNINLAAIQSSELSADDKFRDNVVNKYIQDLYRFYRLFRRKGEFSDPFASPVNLTQVPLLAPDLTDAATLQLVGEFYFKRGYYSDAVILFNDLTGIVPPDASLFQKMGYCYQQSGNIDDALRYYSQAELLNADSVWTLRRIAACYKLSGLPDKALDYFKRIEVRHPDDLSVALNIGHCLLEMDRYDEAMKYYYKVEFLDSGTSRAWRPLAWCAFMCRDFSVSRKYYEMVLADNPTAGDYLNMGHLNVASGNIREALNFYKLSADNDPDRMEGLIRSINADKPVLQKAGIDISVLPLLVDSMLYAADS